MSDSVRLSILMFTSSSMICDLALEKIPNILVLSGFFAGAALQFPVFRWSCMISALAGAFLPLAAGGVLWKFGMIGAGDVKLLAAAGFMTGYPGILSLIKLSVLCGGCISAALMLSVTGSRPRLRYFINYMRTLCVSGGAGSYRAAEARRPEHFHFAVPVFMAAALYAAGLQC